MVYIRKYTNNDISLLIDYLNNQAVTKYLTSRIPHPYTLEDAQWWINEGANEGIIRAIEFRDTFVGTIGATPGAFELANTAEIGYWVAEAYWGKGIATQALSSFTNYIFETTDLVRLFARVFEGNAVSMRVLEKAGYRCESIQQKAAFKDNKNINVHIYVKFNS